MRQGAGLCPRIIALLVTCCLQLQNDSGDEDGRRKQNHFLGSSMGRGMKTILSLRLLRGLMRVRTRNRDEERLKIKCGDHRSMKPAAGEFAEAGDLKWAQKPDQVNV